MRYCLKHYTEDLEGGTFTLAESEELKGITDAVITPTPKDYEGFTPITPIAKYTITIPSTPGEIRYSRNTYTLSFDLDGGSFPASATFTGGKFLYEQHVTTAVSPVKQGYTFKGWDSYPSTMPAKDVTVKAIWEANTTRMAGDVNEDGVVNMKDLTRLQHGTLNLYKKLSPGLRGIFLPLLTFY